MGIHDEAIPVFTEAGSEQLQVGDTVEENALTNYDTLGKLIYSYNHVVKSSDLQVDRKLEDLCDVLAHGRMFSNEPRSPLKLMKFSPAENGRIKVTHAELIDDAWLAGQASRVHAELEKVVKADDALRRSEL